MVAHLPETFGKMQQHRPPDPSKISTEPLPIDFNRRFRRLRTAFSVTAGATFEIYNGIHYELMQHFNCPWAYLHTLPIDRRVAAVV